MRFTDIHYLNRFAFNCVFKSISGTLRNVSVNTCIYNYNVNRNGKYRRRGTVFVKKASANGQKLCLMRE